MEIPSEAIVGLPLILATPKFPLVAAAIVKNVSPTVRASSEIVTGFGHGQRCGWEGQTDCLGRTTGQEGRGGEVSPCQMLQAVSTIQWLLGSQGWIRAVKPGKISQWSVLASSLQLSAGHSFPELPFWHPSVSSGKQHAAAPVCLLPSAQVTFVLGLCISVLVSWGGNSRQSLG